MKIIEKFMRVWFIPDMKKIAAVLLLTLLLFSMASLTVADVPWTAIRLSVPGVTNDLPVIGFIFPSAYSLTISNRQGGAGQYAIVTFAGGGGSSQNSFATNSLTATNAINWLGWAGASNSIVLAIESARTNAVATNVVAGVITNNQQGTSFATTNQMVGLSNLVFTAGFATSNDVNGLITSNNDTFASGLAASGTVANAGSSTSSSYADYANQAGYANWAGNADLSGSAGYANYAGYVYQANYADSAGTADSAGYASNAGYANWAGNADLSGSAGYANYAGYVYQAANADWASGASTGFNVQGGNLTAYGFNIEGGYLIGDSGLYVGGSDSYSPFTVDTGGNIVGSNLTLNGSLTVGGSNVVLQGQAVTNGGFIINGQAIQNGGSITVTGSNPYVLTNTVNAGGNNITNLTMLAFQNGGSLVCSGVVLTVTSCSNGVGALNLIGGPIQLNGQAIGTLFAPITVTNLNVAGLPFDPIGAAANVSHATNADFSTAGNYATNSKTATFASSALYATNSGSATFSASSLYATQSLYSASSLYATNAGSALDWLGLASWSATGTVAHATAWDGSASFSNVLASAWNAQIATATNALGTFGDLSHSNSTAFVSMLNSLYDGAGAAATARNGATNDVKAWVTAQNYLTSAPNPYLWTNVVNAGGNSLSNVTSIIGVSSLNLIGTPIQLNGQAIGTLFASPTITNGLQKASQSNTNNDAIGSASAVSNAVTSLGYDLLSAATNREVSLSNTLSSAISGKISGITLTNTGELAGIVSGSGSVWGIGTNDPNAQYNLVAVTTGSTNTSAGLLYATVSNSSTGVTVSLLGGTNAVATYVAPVNFSNDTRTGAVVMSNAFGWAAVGEPDVTKMTGSVEYWPTQLTTNGSSLAVINVGSWVITNRANWLDFQSPNELVQQSRIVGLLSPSTNTWHRFECLIARQWGNANAVRESLGADYRTWGVASSQTGVSNVHALVYSGTSGTEILRGIGNTVYTSSPAADTNTFNDALGSTRRSFGGTRFQPTDVEWFAIEHNPTNATLSYYQSVAINGRAPEWRWCGTQTNIPTAYIFGIYAFDGFGLSNSVSCRGMILK